MSFDAVRAGTLSVYEDKARWWQTHRDVSLYEAEWLARLTQDLKPGARMLDLGCGTGQPIAFALAAQGFEVLGLDASEAMIALAEADVGTRANPVFRVGDIRDLPEIGSFGAILSWDGFFHLSQSEQRLALPDIASRLDEGGTLLLTVGPGAGEVLGRIDGEPVYHASLSRDDYADVLGAAGCDILDFAPEDKSAWGRTVLLAKRVGKC